MRYSNGFRGPKEVVRGLQTSFLPHSGHQTVQWTRHFTGVMRKQDPNAGNSRVTIESDEVSRCHGRFQALPISEIARVTGRA